jgi:hypothetical protein
MMEKAIDLLHELDKEVAGLRENVLSNKIAVDKLQDCVFLKNAAMIERQERHEAKTESTDAALADALNGIKYDLGHLMATIGGAFLTLKYCAILITVLVSAGWAVLTFSQG